MTIFMVLKCFAFMGFAISDSAILTRPPDASFCVGNNVTIAWEYDNSANLLSASWTFNNGTLYTIMQKFKTGVPTVPTSSPLTVKFIENGRIMLIETLSSYTGTYALSLTYRPGSPDSDPVDIIINDVPQPLAFQKDETSNTFNCSGSSSIPTVFRVSTSDRNVRYEASPYTSNVTTEVIECCYNGSAANCSNEKFTAKYGTIYCQQVWEASEGESLTGNNPVPAITGGVAAAVAVTVALVVFVLARRRYRKHAGYDTEQSRQGLHESSIQDDSGMEIYQAYVVTDALGVVPSASSGSSNIYAQVNKHTNKGQNASGDNTYAVVNKSKPKAEDTSMRNKVQEKNKKKDN